MTILVDSVAGYDRMNTMNKNSARKVSETATTVAHCPTKYNILNAAHASFAPVQCKTAIMYMSGARQITEFRVDESGFRVLVWVQDMLSGKPVLRGYDPAEGSAKKLWKVLEIDCLSGHARLSDRASVRVVGSNPAHRAECRATDDVSAVVNWIRRAEVWYDKQIQSERKGVLKGTSMQEIADGAESKIRFIPPRLEAELASDERVNRSSAANVERIHLVVGCVKHWDSEGRIAVRGKRVGSLSTRTVIGRIDMIARRTSTAQWQGERSTALESEDPVLSELYREMQLESLEKAAKIQADLNERMAKARAARAAHAARKLRNLETVEVTANVAEAMKDEAEAPARMASAKKEAEVEATE